MSRTAATSIAFRAVKRYLTPLSSTRSPPIRHLQAPAVCARILPRHFSSSCVLRAEQDAAVKSGIKQRTAASKRATNNSLRNVAVAAQSQRHGLIRGSGRTRHVDPEADTKEVTAYCAAEKYNLSSARWELDRAGYKADPFGTNLFPQVLHVQTRPTDDDISRGLGDLFVFPSGCVVAWNVPDKLARHIIERFLPSAAEHTSHPETMEIEDLDYIEDPNRETSQIFGDTIVLGTNAAQSNASTSGKQTSQVDTILAKIAFSSALGRSTKLAVLENALSSYFSKTMSIPVTLSSGKPLKYTQSEVLRRTGELLLMRAQLNLYSELTDSLPDLFWDSPHELGLEGYYDMVGKALDVGVRIKVLNEKMDYASEITAVLREKLSQGHTNMLEWTIIWLIVVEVVFGVVHLWWDSEEREDRKGDRKVMELFEQYLERELKKDK